MLTVRRTVNGAPFALRVSGETSKTFKNRGIVVHFDPPIVGKSETGAPVYAEFLVYANVSEESFLAYVHETDEKARIKMLESWGTPTPASSPVPLKAPEFLSWQSVIGDRMLAGTLLANGIAAVEPQRAGATTPEAIVSKIDAAYALLGLPVPGTEEDSEEDSEEDTAE